ncbi:hypothetical protein SLE2022_321680 [Rubroshorea leprosula]
MITRIIIFNTIRQRDFLENFLRQLKGDDTVVVVEVWNRPMKRPFHQSLRWFLFKVIRGTSLLPPFCCSNYQNLDLRLVDSHCLSSPCHDQLIEHNPDDFEFSTPLMKPKSKDFPFVRKPIGTGNSIEFESVTKVLQICQT